MLDKTWQVSYASVSIACKTENDAKLLARQLMKKGYRVRAETLEGQNPMRVITWPLGYWNNNDDGPVTDGLRQY